MNKESVVAFHLPCPVSPPGTAQSLYLYPYPGSPSRAWKSAALSTVAQVPPFQSLTLSLGPLSPNQLRRRLRPQPGLEGEATPTWRGRLGLVGPPMGGGDSAEPLLTISQPEKPSLPAGQETRGAARRRKCAAAGLAGRAGAEDAEDPGERAGRCPRPPPPPTALRRALCPNPVSDPPGVLRPVA